MNKTKELIKRFKAWLITKLGGYTNAPDEVVVYKSVELNPIVLSAKKDDVNTRWTSEQEIKAELASRLVEQIIDKRLYYLLQCRDIKTGLMSFRMQLFMVDPDKYIFKE